MSERSLTLLGLLGGKELELLFSSWRVVVFGLEIFVVVSASASRFALAVWALVFAGHSVVAVVESCEAERWKQLLALPAVLLLGLALEASHFAATVSNGGALLGA